MEKLNFFTQVKQYRELHPGLSQAEAQQLVKAQNERDKNGNGKLIAIDCGSCGHPLNNDLLCPACGYQFE